MALAGDIVRYDGREWDLVVKPGDENPDGWITDDPSIWSSHD